MVCEAAARSARTRRSSRSSRGWTTGVVVVQGFRSGLSRNGRGRNGRVECRVDSVKHSSSPSRRENTRRAIRSQVFKASLRHRTSALFDCRAAAYLSLSSSTRSRTPRSQSLHRRQASYFPCLIHPVRISLNASATPGNSDTEQPFSYCYELSTQLRLESAANAHTAADLHVRSWVSNRAGQESLERRERVTNTPSAISDNP
jgi:hypothetical protein